MWILEINAVSQATGEPEFVNFLRSPRIVFARLYLTCPPGYMG
jgi:hypothetical protein